MVAWFFCLVLVLAQYPIQVCGNIKMVGTIRWRSRGEFLGPDQQIH